MPIIASELTAILKTAFPDATLMLKDLAGDDDHWEVTITSPQFQGKTHIEQHKMVQTAVKDCNIHALSIKTKAG